VYDKLLKPRQSFRITLYIQDLESKKGNLEDQDIDRQETLTWILKKQGWRAWKGFTWLKIQTSGWTFVSMEINFQVPYNEGHFLPEEQLASQEGLYCMEFLVIQSSITHLRWYSDADK